MKAQHGPFQFPVLWIVAVASLIPLTAAMVSTSEPPGRAPLPTQTSQPASESAPSDASAADPAAVEATQDRPVFIPREPDEPAPHRILVIGDSHTAGTFGRALDLLLKSIPGSDVMTVGSCGASPDGFLLPAKGTRCGFLHIAGDELAFRKRHQKTPAIDDLLDTHRPDTTVVELGANQIHTAMGDPEGAAADIRELADRVVDRGSRCVWVGPPYGSKAKKPPERVDHLYRLLERSLPEDCLLVDSRPSSLPFLDWVTIAKDARRSGDGRHFDSLGIFGQHAARRWARQVFLRVQEHLNAEEEQRFGTRLADAALLTTY